MGFWSAVGGGLKNVGGAVVGGVKGVGNGIKKTAKGVAKGDLKQVGAGLLETAGSAFSLSPTQIATAAAMDTLCDELEAIFRQGKNAVKFAKAIRKLNKCRKELKAVRRGQINKLPALVRTIKAIYKAVKAGKDIVD